MIYGGNGAGDVIWAGNQGSDVFGGNGGTTANHDTIYGYSSPIDETAAATWIFGGSGTNVIMAGISSGDYLKGGSGNDTIDAALTDSAWIDGGTGNNNGSFEF
jgi:Ca2+-binding RTX toxin-like protein